MKICVKYYAIVFFSSALAFTACGGDTPLSPDAQAVSSDTAALDSSDLIYGSGDSPTNVTKNFTLPSIGSSGTIISWIKKNDLGNNITLSGVGNSAATVTWPETSGFGPYTVTLTATLTKAAVTATKDIELIVKPTETTKILTTVDTVPFKMVLAPGGKTFPTGTNDEGTAFVANAYWIGEVEVKYELWKKVYTWATSGSVGTGAGQYTFSNQGREGHDGTIGAVATNHEPVTSINWRDSIVWCNALTEWYNTQKGTSYSCVYFSNSEYSTPLRNSSDGIYGLSVNSTAGSVDAPYVKTDATGFRLPTSNEWELAARYRDGTLWTYGDHASGDMSGACYDDGSMLGGLSLSTEFGNYAVYSINSGYLTAAVKSKTTGYNALALYDMSGNVFELCFDWHPSFLNSRRVRRGGGYGSSDIVLQVGIVYNHNPYEEESGTGFRFVRTP